MTVAKVFRGKETIARGWIKRLSAWSRKRNKPANANAVLDAIKHLGFGKGEMSAHGFRSIASTILNESGKFNSDAIERQLSHVPGNKVRASYNYAQHIEERRGMMQWYADHLDDLEKKYALSIAPPIHECKTA